MISIGFVNAVNLRMQFVNVFFYGLIISFEFYWNEPIAKVTIIESTITK